MKTRPSTPAHGERSITDLIPTVVGWRLTSALDGEAARWESFDGRWVALRVGRGLGLCRVMVQHSDGRTRIVTSHEEALALAKTWRD